MKGPGSRSRFDPGLRFAFLLIETLQKVSKGCFPLTRFWLGTLTHVNFNHVNKIEKR